MTHREKRPDWHNAPVQSFGPADARLLIVGLAPGLRGANRTGRPFTGDFAGNLLYHTLIKCGLATGQYGAEASDGLQLVATRITNSVRCVPPENKPLPVEIATCQPFLIAELATLQDLRVILALGLIAHQQVLRLFGLRVAAYPFGHNRQFTLPGGLTLIDSYHCSRQNTSTKRLTTPMFEAVFETIGPLIG